MPLTFSITRQLNVPVKPFLVAQILASNIGGTSTLIGDPPNIMIGSAVPEMDFMAFLTNLSGVCIVTFIVTIAILLFLYRKQLVTTDELRAKVMAMDERQEIKDSTLLKNV